MLYTEIFWEKKALAFDNCNYYVDDDDAHHPSISDHSTCHQISSIRRKRRRRVSTTHLVGAKQIMFTITMFLSICCGCISISAAYTPPLFVSSPLFGTSLSVASTGGGGLAKGMFRRLQTLNPTTIAANKIAKNKKKKKKDIEEEEKGSEDDDEEGWLSWMVRGRVSRGTEDLLMREAEELGGIPRSDRYSSSDWFHNTMTLPGSAILRDISSPVTFMTIWAAILSLLNWHLVNTRHIHARCFCIPTTPHSLMVSALSLLLVFKTNSAYQRFAEARKIWESIINASRDLYRMLNLYENEIGRSKRRRLQRLLASFPYLLRHRVRPDLVMYRLDDEENVRDPQYSIVLYEDRAANELDPEAAAVAKQEENEGKSRRKTRPLYWVDKGTLPWRLLPPDALEPCARAQNRPLWVCDRMAQELRLVPDGPNFSARERLSLISKVDKLSGCIGACERIHQTAVPLNYARHSLRALTLWLFTLPFALVDSLELMTAPVLFLVSWLLFGVYEIGYSIEDPFQGTLRLSVLCDSIRRDVLGDEIIRSTAFGVIEEEKGKEPVVVAGDEDDYESSVLVVEDIVEAMGETMENIEEDTPQFFNVSANGGSTVTVPTTNTTAPTTPVQQQQQQVEMKMAP